MNQFRNNLGFSIKTALPQSVQVANAIRTEILVGRMRKDTRLLPTRVLADRFKVSKRVVQSAYEILQREGLVEGRVGQGTFVAYDDRSVAARTVLLALCGLADEHERLHTLLPEALLDKGLFNFTFDATNLAPCTLHDRIRDAINERPLALVVDAMNDFSAGDIGLLPPTRLVFAKHCELTTRIPGASYVLADYAAAGRIATGHLRTCGRRRIVLLNHKHVPGSRFARLAQGCLEVIPECVEILPRRLDSDALDHLLFDGAPPDGIICAQDYLYVSVVDLFLRRGLVLGRDYDVVGCHNTPWAKAYKIPSVDYGMDVIAAKVAEILKTGEHVDMMIAPELVLNGA